MTRDELDEQYPGLLFADGFDEAFIGVVNPFGNEPVAVYDEDKCIDILARDMSYDEAREFFYFNTAGAYVGPRTPLFMSPTQLTDE